MNADLHRLTIAGVGLLHSLPNKAFPANPFAVQTDRIGSVQPQPALERARKLLSPILVPAHFIDLCVSDATLQLHAEE